MNHGGNNRREGPPLGQPKSKTSDCVRLTTRRRHHNENQGQAGVRSTVDLPLSATPPLAEIDCKASQPNSAAVDTAGARQTRYHQWITARTEIQDQGNRLRHPAALKEIDRSVCL